MKTLKVYMVQCLMGPMKEEVNEDEPGFEDWYKYYKKLDPKFEDNPKRDLNMMGVGSCYIDLYEDGKYIGSAKHNYNTFIQPTTKLHSSTDKDELPFGEGDGSFPF